jgi:methyl-accepting chemotaxis protein
MNFNFASLKNLSIRYKLIGITLILILVPLLISSYDAISTSNKNIQKIITSKLNSDLKVAWQIYNQELKNTETTAKNLSNNNNLLNYVMANQSELLNDWLKTQKEASKLSILTALDTKGVVIGSANNPELAGSKIYQGPTSSKSLEGKVQSSTEILPSEIIKSEKMEKLAKIEGAETDDAMAFISFIPLADSYNNLMGVLVAGKLINNDFSIVDRIKETAGGTATIFMRDLRISTNVTNKAGTRAVGTKVSKPVFEAVLNNGESFRGRAFVVTDWFIAAYDPIKNHKGENIGILYTGVDESPFTSIQNSFRNRVLILVLMFVVFGAVITYFVSGFIVNPIVRTSEMLKDIAQGEGDLTKRLDISSKDEVGDLAKWFNVFVAKLRAIMLKIADSTDQLASAAEQLSASSSQISAGTDKQASQTEQIATSMEEMSATVIDIAKNASEAAGAANNATQSAGKGGEIVRNTVDGMNRIAGAVRESASTIEALKRSSEQIGEIIGVIDEIADQTNLLALNAAIEAARAGEQGRGFAVVADEVRKLAERTTKATREIAEMIKSIQSETGGAVSAMESGSQEVEKGVTLANEAGEALHQIVEQVNKVTDMVQQIATSTEEQSAAAEEISSNVESVATIARESTTGIEQSTGAAQELSNLATSLKSIVQQFKLKETA